MEKSTSDVELYELDEELDEAEEAHDADDADDFVDDSNKGREVLSEEEVYVLSDSDEHGDDDDSDVQIIEDKEQDEFDMGSDIVEDEKVTDDRAWGKSNKQFYNTDYVDQDYEGFYVGKEAEEAEIEEKEAKQIQKRLTGQLNEADFDVTNVVEIPVINESEAYEEIKRDIAILSKIEKLDLLQKESPELFMVIEDFKSKLAEIEDIYPVLISLKDKQQSSNEYLFLNRVFLILTNYCTNISFYLMLKARGIPVQDHPVLKSLFEYRKLVEQIQSIDRALNGPIEGVSKHMEADEELTPVENIISEKKEKDKNILKLLSKSKLEKPEVDSEDKRINESKKHKKSIHMGIEGSELNDNDVYENKNQEEGKRAITYEMAKNKGLMPKRNKDQRNPRVKHRKKYRKALIRRRGQVRTPRGEIPVYGGETSGIKVGVTKSIKFK